MVVSTSLRLPRAWYGPPHGPPGAKGPPRVEQEEAAAVGGRCVASRSEATDKPAAVILVI